MGNYSAQNGYVYQYYLDSHQRSDQNSEYIFMVNRDGQRVFPLLVLVCGDALAAWADRHGHALTENEASAAAKLCLFRAFDEVKELEKTPAVLAVAPAQVDTLLAAVGIE